MNILKKFAYRSYQVVFKLAIPFLPYRKPKLLVDNLALVTLFEGLKPLIITDKTLMQLGLLNKLLELLRKNDISYFVYDGVKPNPTISDVEETRFLYLENNCTALLAIGGGSAMDLAKACGARIVRPKKSISQMKGLLHIHKKLPLLVAIPTTAGTGSETTLAAVITDEKLHYKYPINDFSLIPHYALLDPDMTINLPPSLTATTGMDALTHAIEAYIGRSTTKETRKMAKEAVNLIVNNIYLAYTDGKNITARKNMLLASHYAGIAFTKSYVGYIHAIAHSLGGQYGAPHGLCNAVIMPYVLNAYGKTAEKKLADLALVAGLATATDSKTIQAKKLCDWIKDINHKMNITTKIKQINTADIPAMAKHAYKEANPLYPVPKLFDLADLEKIYYEVAENV